MGEEVSTRTTEFECTGCETTKRASIEYHDGKAKTKHHCTECEEETVWVETGWTEIEIE